jgi:hypothetical protein
LFFSCGDSDAAPRQPPGHRDQFLAKTTSGAAGNGLGTTINYLCGAAGNGREQR